MKNLMEMTEQELREYEVPWPKTKKELDHITHCLTNRKHDYGTKVYAMSIAATATFNYMASKLGCAGFQASCADMDILRRTRMMKDGFMLINYSDLLYPQYKEKIGDSWNSLIEENKEHLSERAKELLKEDNFGAYPDVINHWEYLSKNHINRKE